MLLLTILTANPAMMRSCGSLINATIARWVEAHYGEDWKRTAWREGRFLNNPHSRDIIERVRQRIRELLNGPAFSGGYRTVWHTLEMEGLWLPRIVVPDIVKELDPEGTELWKTHKLRRREYHSPGPNCSWHMNGYDKLKPWGFLFIAS